FTLVSFCFFFSSRRRHTRSTRDWSSDVCSSDLISFRFFHAKKYGLHRPCSRQNAVTVCPLRACSEISLRHFVRAFFPRLVMSQRSEERRVGKGCKSQVAVFDERKNVLIRAARIE